MSFKQKRRIFRGVYVGILIFCFLGLQIGAVYAQTCGYASGLGCSQTNYSNFGTSSAEINNPVTLEYDNFISGYHSTIVRTYDGDLKTWGAFMGYKGNASSDGHVFNPQIINSQNYPGLTGAVLKATLGTNGSSRVQSVLLTTTGLFAWGREGVLLDESITNDRTFQKLSERAGNKGIGNANEFALPVGVTPTDVKMLFGTFESLAIVTCDGEGYVLSQYESNRGSGKSNNNAYSWSQVQVEPGVPLTNIVIPSQKVCL